MNEDFGEVVQTQYDPSLPRIVQLVLTKWYHTKSEPDTTWMVGDIDQLPLQREHFIDLIADVPDNNYVHLAQNAVTILSDPNPDKWRLGYLRGGRGDLTAHYHAAKGRTFEEFLQLHLSLAEHVHRLTQMKLDELGIEGGDLQAHEDARRFWAFEESYTTNLIRDRLNQNRFTGFNRPHDRKICRSKNSSFSKELMSNKHYVDYHCPRPYKKHVDIIGKVLEAAWGDWR